VFDIWKIAAWLPERACYTGTTAAIAVSAMIAVSAANAR
jgi:hypothetical protein